MRPHIVFAAYQSSHHSNGGLESATLIFENLKEDYRWTFFTNRESRFTNRWRQGGATICLSRFDESANVARRWLQRIRWALVIARAMRKECPDAVHLNCIQTYRVLSLLPKSFRQRIIFTLRDTRPSDASYGPIWTKLAGDAGHVVVLSNEMGRHLTERVPAMTGKVTAINSIVAIPPLPDHAGRAAVRTHLGIAENQFAIGCVGALRDKKNQLQLIRHASPAIAAALPHAHFHFLGDYDPGRDHYCRRCQEAVAAGDLDAVVTFHGHTSDMSAWYRALDLIVIGSRFEGLARCMIEGMAHGIPVVSTAVCSAREMLDETGAGIVVDHAAWDKFSTAVIDLGKASPCRETMGIRGRAVATQQFSVDRVVSSYRDLYRQVLGGANENCIGGNVV